ncbi:MAG TPA: tRNA (adenosine(37)-N6)-threonylcarbamoyltransferase complex ATPase subunit type 1 TsaE [Candidatus Magasanikbacteria bacterium]|nr:tRNA (adenosine(37)-N6)-threonylcarbamoyltransferase complex ATPase subunit type 1 TsaE [Candidatus Magasanikbacteria bacterium]
MKYTTNSEQELINLGKKIAVNFKAGDIILLEGNLGAGKTTLTKGIAEYFGIKKNITSPTFSLMNVYEIKRFKDLKIKRLVHVDTYRLEDEEDLIEIGIEDYLGAPDTICLIEWPEKIEGLLRRKKVIRIKIEHDGDGRKIMISDK